MELLLAALLRVIEPERHPPSKVGEIGLFQPQWTVGIFGALVSNDRAAVWAEGESHG